MSKKVYILIEGRNDGNDILEYSIASDGFYTQKEAEKELKKVRDQFIINSNVKDEEIRSDLPNFFDVGNDGEFDIFKLWIETVNVPE